MPGRVCAHVWGSRLYGAGWLGGMRMSSVCFCAGCGSVGRMRDVLFFFGGGGRGALGHSGYACKCVSVGCVDQTCVCIQNGAHTQSVCEGNRVLMCVSVGYVDIG